MTQNKHDVSDPDVNPKMNPLFVKPGRDTRMDSLKQVLEVLTQAKPVNLFSPIMIVAPKAVHNGWRFAVNELGINRHVEYKTVSEFYAAAPLFEDQWVIIADDVYPDQRPKLLAACKLLNMDLGPRFFTVTPVYKAPVADEDQLRILQIVPMTKIETGEDPNG
jgi:hypothetical protein